MLARWPALACAQDDRELLQSTAGSVFRAIYHPANTLSPRSADRGQAALQKKNRACVSISRSAVRRACRAQVFGANTAANLAGTSDMQQRGPRHEYCSHHHSDRRLRRRHRIGVPQHRGFRPPPAACAVAAEAARALKGDGPATGWQRIPAQQIHSNPVVSLLFSTGTWWTGVRRHGGRFHVACSASSLRSSLPTR